MEDKISLTEQLLEDLIMDKRYWFIHYSFVGNVKEGNGNLGYVSDKDHPLNNEYIRKATGENNVVITNIVEFKSKEDYVNFWKK